MLLNQKEIEDALRKYIPSALRSEIRKAARMIGDAEGIWREVDLNENFSEVLSLHSRDIYAPGGTDHKGFKIRAFVIRQS